MVVVWIAGNSIFWAWWLRPGNAGDLLLYGLFTAAWAYEATVLPSMYLFFVGRMRRPRHMPAPCGRRVALITLCVPAQETLDVIERQLAALADVRYPHDSWILDEGNDPRVQASAARFGVRYFSRRGIEHYNQPRPPYKAKTKAGNVNAWLDAHGAAYDFFAQFDIDHRPYPEYIHRVLGYFADSRIAWVQAPSLYGNVGQSWVARGAAEQELVLQGPLQRGFFGHSETPFIIGSHSTYRTSAINEIGGFQPTRAEDHLDTVVLAAHGYRGVFVPETLAVGDGPETFETYLRQQFAWALSMIQVLFSFTPRLVSRYRFGQAVQVLFAETWYPLWSASMLVLFGIPLLALLTGRQPARSVLWQFGAASMPQALTAYVAWRWTRRWQLPQGLGLSWRGIVLHIARWPIVLWALVNAVLHIRHPYMITPKGETAAVPVFSLRSQAVYLSMVVIGLGIVWRYLLSDTDDQVDGYVAFALLGAAYMLWVVVTNVSMDLLELHRRGQSRVRALRLRGSMLATVAVVSCSLALTACASHDLLVAAAVWNSSDAASDALSPGASAARQVLESTESVAASSRDHESRIATAQARADLAEAIENEPVPVAPQKEAPINPPALNQIQASDSRILIGAYDPWQDGADLQLGIEHWYVRQDDPRLFADALDHAAKSGRVPMITIEPFPHREHMPVLERVSWGLADDELRAAARLVAERQPQVVLLRWGQEMDLSGLYPWSANDPNSYRAAFRHVVSVFRAEGATNARWVWSPAGEAGATAYDPGADVVDYVGLTVLGDAEWDWDMGFETPRSLSQILQPRYAEVANLGKPVLLAEVGTSGTEDEQRTWLESGLNALSEYPLVRALVYFNDRNAPNNHRPTEPNWRVPGRVIAEILARADAS